MDSSVVRNLIFAGYQAFLQPDLPVIHGPALLCTLSPSEHLRKFGIGYKQRLPHSTPLPSSCYCHLILANASLFPGNTVGGPFKEVTVYQAELQGIHTLLVILEFFCEQ